MADYWYEKDQPWRESRGSITRVVIEPGVTSIGVGAFAYSDYITSVSIPGTVTSIGTSAFRDTDLTSVTIPASVTSMGRWPFGGCDSLSSVTIERSGEGDLSFDSMPFRFDSVHQATLAWTGPEGYHPVYGVTPSDAGYSVSGSTLSWEGEPVVATLHTTLIPNEYTVAFDANGGEGTMGSQGFTYGTEQALSTCTFTYKGHVFVGWKDADGNEYADGESVKNLTTENGVKVTLYAQWEPEEYTVTWLNDDGSTIGTTRVKYGEKPIHDDTTKAETDQYTYTFKGWSPDIADVRNAIAHAAPVDSGAFPR